MSALVAMSDEREIRRLYHEATQMLTVLLVPVAAVLTLFPLEIVRAWTADAAIAAQVAPIVGLLAVGVAINGLMHIPFALQLAYGWTSIGLALTIGQVVVFLPLLVWVAARFGGAGAACVWALLNATYLSLGIPWTHRRLLRGDASRWLLSDVCLPASGAVLVAVIGRLLVKESPSTIQTLLLVGAVLAASGVAAFGLSPLAMQAARRLHLQESDGRLS
jgi:O-antigen/teichoic acid export membrane protein